MLRAIFDLVDALAALQQAVSMPVQALSGSWDWMLLRVAGAWAALLLQVMQLADATATHVLAPSADTSAALLTQVCAWLDPGHHVHDILVAARPTDYLTICALLAAGTWTSAGAVNSICSTALLDSMSSGCALLHMQNSVSCAIAVKTERCVPL